MPSKMNLRRIKIRDKVSKNTIEWIGILILLIFSFINVATLFISLVILIFFLNQREIGAIKILNVITLRTIINTGLAVDIESVQSFKWSIIFLCSFYLIFSYRKIDKNLKMKMNCILYPILSFGIYSVIASIFTSTLPVIAVFKLISYIIVFVGILIGVYVTNEEISWLNWINKMFMLIFIFSLPLIQNSTGYLRNGHSFQGITNQPNMLGIILALFFSIILTRLQLNEIKNKLFTYIILGGVLYLGVLTKSRTSLITMIILMIVYLFFLQVSLIKRILVFNFIGMFTIVYMVFNNQILSEIQVFLYKGQENILNSRYSQIDGLLSNFRRNPLFGSGFAVPVTPFTSYAFNSEYVVEPGNLILSVLSYGGILGLVLFIVYLFRIGSSPGINYRQSIFLFLSPILISMGEMVFFSSNNIGIWCYMFIAIYISMTPRDVTRLEN